MTVLEFQRRTRDLSQQELANRVLYSRSVISQLETKRMSAESVHPRLRKALEDYFDLTLEDLLASV